jgi:hypothetical protein
MLVPGCALQRLLRLSDLFIIALCTKPPMPLVGDAGRSEVVARRACEDNIVGVWPSVDCSLSVLDVRSDQGEAFS